jgi:TonB family protein
MDLFLEQCVRDLVATAQQQLASEAYTAARGTYRIALDEVEGALALDPSNPTAALLRQQLIEAMAQVPAPGGHPAEPPAFERGDILFAPMPGGYHPDSGMLSILDTTPRPEKPDYWKAAAAALIVLQLAVAVRVVSYYGSRHEPMDNTPLEQRAKYALQPASAPAITEPENVDDTIYWTEPGLTLPLLLHKSEPVANAQGTVVLVAVIDPTGTPINMQVRRGLTPDLNVLAIQAVEKWRFRPGSKDGKPVPVVAQLEVRFHP